MNTLTELKDGKYIAKNSSNIDDIIQKLGKYEQAEENGLLLKLPCKEGTRVYKIVEECNALSCPKKSCKKCGYYNPHITPMILSLSQIVLNLDEFNKTIFFKEEDAKIKLKEYK